MNLALFFGCFHNLPHLVEVSNVIPDIQVPWEGLPLGVVPAAGDAGPVAPGHVAGEGVPNEEDLLPRPGKRPPKQSSCSLFLLLWRALDDRYGSSPVLFRP